MRMSILATNETQSWKSTLRLISDAKIYYSTEAINPALVQSTRSGECSLDESIICRSGLASGPETWPLYAFRFPDTHVSAEENPTE